jgi:uncharacterized protein (DUF4415 family)
MRAARSRGESRTDWERVRPVVGEPKAAISLRLPVSVLDRWKATGPGWQTRMAEVLSKTAT